MKKTFIIAITVLLLASCAKDAVENTLQKETVSFSCSVEQVEDLTSRTALENRSVIWNVGDEISVLTSTSNDRFTVKSVDESNKSKAVFSGMLTKGQSRYYAFYPFSLTTRVEEDHLLFELPKVQTYAKNTFAPEMFPMVAQFSYAGDPLTFKNILGVLKLNLTGDGTHVSRIVLQDRYGEALCGNASLMINDKMCTEDQTLVISNASNTLVMDCTSEDVTLSSTATPFYFVVPAGSLGRGLDVYVYSGDNLVSYLTTDNDNMVFRSKSISMPSRVGGAPQAEYDLSYGGKVTANSYIAPIASKYRFKATKGNSNQSVTASSVGIIWATENTTEAPSSLDAIVKDVAMDNGYITFATTGKYGNALLAAYSGPGCTGDILWSWHIWCPERYIESHLYPVESEVIMMDRNMGALGYRKEDGALAAGLLYQWGRKDPFHGAATIEAPSQKTTAPKQAVAVYATGVSYAAVDNAVAQNGTMDYAIKHPTTFIICAKEFNDNDWLIGHDASLWIKNKTMYDPCPAGYRIPDEAYNWAWYASGAQFDAEHRGYMFYGTEWTVESGYVYRAAGTWCGGYDAMYELWACSETAINAFYQGLHADKNSITGSKSTGKKANAYGVRCCVDRPYK
ncbi:MAG: hypothetical protein KBS95_05560 [Alistipes sp.]|nr:hypothetical protein [Candidatus Alistipes equi]